jgi:sortase A
MTKSNNRTSGRLRRAIEYFLLLTGVLGVGVWVGSKTTTAVWQDWNTWVFDREIRHEPGTMTAYLRGRTEQLARRAEAWFGLAAAPEPSGLPPSISAPVAKRPLIASDGLVGRLVIPRLRVRAIVREGTGENTLGVAVGHIPGTAFPGQEGNVGLAGHRDTLFRGLEQIRKGDVIQFETLDRRYAYEVESTDVVKPQNVSVLKPRRHLDELTLVTCYPFDYIGAAPDRFIVKAREVPLDAQARPDVTRKDSAGPIQKADLRGQDCAGQADCKPLAMAEKAAAGKANFVIPKNHSRQLAPGISLGITETDVTAGSASGWMWIMPDRRTIWLRDQGVREPLIFYGNVDGKRHEVLITKVSENSVTGYLLLSGQ